MNRKELIEDMAGRASLSKADCEKALSAFQEAVGDALDKDEAVTLVGFGTFKVSERSERKGRNPSTNQEITIPARRVPRFVVGKKLKDKVQ